MLEVKPREPSIPGGLAGGDRRVPGRRALLMRYTFAVGRRSRGSLAHWLAGCATLVAVAVALIAAVAAFYVLMIG